MIEGGGWQSWNVKYVFLEVDCKKLDKPMENFFIGGIGNRNIISTWYLELNW